MAEQPSETSEAIILAPTDEAGLKALCDNQRNTYYWRADLERPVTIVYVCGDDRRVMLQISRRWENWDDNVKHLCKVLKVKFDAGRDVYG